MSDYQTLEQSGGERHRARDLSLQGRKPPTRVPGYEPQQFLGAGAYGEVWTAVDRRTGRRVAIKFYAHRGGLDWSLLSREVEKLAFLFADRYVVQLLDVGWDADPPYYIMEYLEQGSLEDRLAAGPLPVGEALVLFREVATGLVHAHGKGVLHCDLKPANVLLDQDLKPRLADFGQSRFSQEQSPALGTLFYMAPEQADLRALPDAGWDVYALGALFYRMIVGRPPHRDEAISAQLERIPDLERRLLAYRQWIVNSPRPSEHRRVPGVDRNLAEIIERCLEPNSHRRYRNVQAVLDDLNLRNARRARRPLLVLGAVGPALLLAVTTYFGYSAFEVAVDESNQAVTRRALESNRFAAQFVADRVAQQVEHRWNALAQVADQPAFRELLAAAGDQPRASQPRRQLQDYLVEARRAYLERSPNEDANWFVNNRRGVQLARSPLDEKTVDRSFAFRDYFHGQGADLSPDQANIAPIQDVHRSIVFRSQATQNCMVAFTVPVWSGGPDDPDRSVLGVLGMTVELGHFAELRAEDRSGNEQLAALVDLRADWKGRAGSIVEHPRLRELTAAAVPDQQVPNFYLEPTWVERLDTARRLAVERQALRLTMRKKAAVGENVDADSDQLAGLSRQLHDLAVVPDYGDPIGGGYRGRWLAAIEPVVAGDNPTSLRDLGWVVVVQERFDSAVQPIRMLAYQLVRRGLLGLGVVLALVTGLWGFVIIVLNESPHRGWLGKLRRGVGLATEGSGSSTTSQTTLPKQPTLTGPGKTPTEPPKAPT